MDLISSFITLNLLQFYCVWMWAKNVVMLSGCGSWVEWSTFGLMGLNRISLKICVVRSRKATVDIFFD